MTDPSSHALIFGEFWLPPGVDLLFRGESVVALEPRPVRLLRYLVENDDRVVSKQELLDRVWNDVFTAEAVLKRAVSQCRRALGDDPDKPSFIETFHGRGYRFIAPVSRSAPADRSSSLSDLPAGTTSFVGREREMERIESRLATARLVTLTGPGGMGKTRLALEVARRIERASAQRVAFAALESLSDPGLVAARVASALGVREEPRREMAETLTAWSRGRKLVIVLDNCEHLLDACADLAGRLLQAGEGVRLLATSREPLGIGGEAVWRVSALAAPASGREESAEELLVYEAVRLFVERARLIEPEFAIDATNAAAVAEICRNLDGIPLAIELAAARLGALTTEEIAERLEDRFSLLTRGDRSATSRQQTLRAAMDWSYDLLGADERRLLAWLSVFAGGWTLDAAEGVVGKDERRRHFVTEDESEGSDLHPQSRSAFFLHPSEVLQHLVRLVDKSLVVASEVEGRTRYRLLETTRRYAAERLASFGESEEARAAHAWWVLELAERAEREWRGPSEKAWLDRLEVEHDNIREALRWGRGAAGDPSYDARLCGALGRFWDVRGYWDEAMEWFDKVLTAHADLPPAVRAKALLGSGMLARHRGDVQLSLERLEESLALYRGEADDWGVALALNVLGNLIAMRGEVEASPRAEAMHEESLFLFDRLNDDRGRAIAHSSLALLAMDRGEYPLARERYGESLRLARLTGDLVSVGIMLHNLGSIARKLGEFDEASALFEESIVLARELGYKSLMLHSVEELGVTATERGEPAAANALYRQALHIGLEIGDRPMLVALIEHFARNAALDGNERRTLVLAGAAAVETERLGVTLPPDERRVLDAAYERARRALGDEAARAAYEEGRRLHLSDAIAAILEE